MSAYYGDPNVNKLRPMQRDEVLARLRAAADPANVAGKARYGINVMGALGVPMPAIRAIAKEIRKDHALALALWDTGIPECRLLAPMIADLSQTDEGLMERWVADLNSWDVCDGLCGNLLDRHPAAWTKAVEWSRRDEEFVRRAGFVLMARLPARDKKAADERFRPFFKLIEQGAHDERNFVKKAVNWALRQIGKRDETLRCEAIACAHRVARQNTAAARWIARDALRELEQETQIARIASRTAKKAAARK